MIQYYYSNIETVKDVKVTNGYYLSVCSIYIYSNIEMVNVTKSHKLLMLLTPKRSRTESYGNLENHGEKHQSSSAIKATNY